MLFAQTAFAGLLCLVQHCTYINPTHAKLGIIADSDVWLTVDDVGEVYVYTWAYRSYAIRSFTGNAGPFPEITAIYRTFVPGYPVVIILDGEVLIAKLRGP